MVIRLLHSAIVRLLLVLAGTVMFVQSSAEVSRGGVALMVAATLLIIAAGADVAYRPARDAGHA